MANGRRYYRPKYVNRDKYSVETTNFRAPLTTSSQTKILVVPSTGVEGMRKCKHFELTFSAQNLDNVVYYALVYVPQGYEPNSLVLPGAENPTTLYEPNQYVLSSGVLDFSGGPLRIRSPLSRNLNSGDAIALVLATATSEGTTSNPHMYGSVKYAITLQ